MDIREIRMKCIQQAVAFYNKNENATPDKVMELAKRFEAFVEKANGSGKHESGKHEKGQWAHPYGFVSKMMKDILTSHPEGVTRQAIRAEVNGRISSTSVTNSLKDHIRKGKMRYEAPLYFWNDESKVEENSPDAFCLKCNTRKSRCDCNKSTTQANGDA